MPALPKLNLSVLCRHFLITFILFSLSTIALARPTQAAPGPPDPRPCENALETDQLTDIYIPDAEGSTAPIAIVRQNIVTAPGPVTISGTETFSVDFSKLQSLFGASNSDYLEGDFQSETHSQADVEGLTSQEFNEYFGPGQKAAPKTIVNDLRQKYVEYLYNNPHLIESENTYTNSKGLGAEKTIYDLVSEYGLPTPPDSGSTDEEKNAWLESWGGYWTKIPTA